MGAAHLVLPLLRTAVADPPQVYKTESSIKTKQVDVFTKHYDCVFLLIWSCRCSYSTSGHLLHSLRR
uniref:RxLR effector candidate protein n=1 Tax=Hyaloperonospora arabidopsidis (strain Emoy2) TaxID=559515 RepID=M4BL91_HYAAE